MTPPPQGTQATLAVGHLSSFTRAGPDITRQARSMNTRSAPLDGRRAAAWSKSWRPSRAKRTPSHFAPTVCCSGTFGCNTSPLSARAPGGTGLLQRRRSTLSGVCSAAPLPKRGSTFAPARNQKFDALSGWSRLHLREFSKRDGIFRVTTDCTTAGMGGQALPGDRRTRVARNEVRCHR